MASNQSDLSVCSSTEECWCSTVRFDQAEYTWKINNFSTYEQKGQDIRSPKFSSPTNNEFSWFLELEPSNKVGPQGSISLFLYLSKDGRCERAFGKLNFYILNIAQEKGFIADVLYHEFNYDLYKGSDDAYRGWHNFLEKDEFFRYKLLKNDTLTISFQLTFFEMDDKSIAEIFHRCNNAHLQHLSKNFASAFENHDFTDFTLSVQGKDYPVHKVILAARSNYFASMFRIGVKENEHNRVEITDVGEDIVGEMLRFIYTGRCENLH